MPHVIVPDAPVELGLTDKEGNSVWRVFVYKAQADDALKALRRRGYTPRLFNYDKAKWESDNKERKVLTEEVKNATI